MSATRRHAARAFGQALRAARLGRGITQEQLAETGDFDRTYPSLLERGLRSPTFFVILSLAQGLNIDPEALFKDAVARLRRQVPTNLPSTHGQMEGKRVALSVKCR
jgi:transcriptional regulator with XRE-family HTH domain